MSPSFQNGCGESPCSESSVAPLIILASAACQKNRVSNARNRLALGSSPGSRSATEGPSGHPAAILLAKHSEKWCGLIEAPSIDMLGCCMAGLVSRQLMKATHPGCMGGRSGSAVSSCFLLRPLRQRCQTISTRPFMQPSATTTASSISFPSWALRVRAIQATRTKMDELAPSTAGTLSASWESRTSNARATASAPPTRAQRQ